MSEPLTPSTGWCVLHLFCKLGAAGAGGQGGAGGAGEGGAGGAGGVGGVDGQAVAGAVKAAQGGDHQVVTFSVFGHKADLGFMALGPDWLRLRALQTDLQAAGLQIVDSYVSLTEVSEYAKGLPQEMLQARLYPKLPPEGKRAFCFYPMSKRRGEGHNWYALGFEEREALMRGHGATGRTFRGRVLQLITGSTGLDDYEWGVTLFAVRPDDLKDVVYTMRFDEASAHYADFGPFYAGVVDEVETVLAQVGRA